MSKKHNLLKGIKAIIFTWVAFVLFSNIGPSEKILLTFVALSIALMFRLASSRLGNS